MLNKELTAVWQRATEVQARAAEMRLATARRRVAQMQAQRQRVLDSQAEAEGGLLADAEGVSAGWMQVLQAGRDVSRARLSSLEDAIGQGERDVHGHVRNRDERQRRHMNAPRVAEYTRTQAASAQEAQDARALEDSVRARAGAVWLDADGGA